MGKILTLIIPSYNMEDYLPYCLDSLLVKAHLDKLEVLVVNDGSRDRTSEIAHGYEKACPDVFRVIDKENGNYGSCINRGLKEASGKYVKILDADDSFDTDNLEKFISYLMETDADLVLSDFAVVDRERTVRKIIRYDLGDSPFYEMDRISSNPVFQNMQMHAVTYRLSVLTSMGYRQSEGISFTDQQWIFLPMTGVRTVAHFNGVVYRYLVGRPGQTVDPAMKFKGIGQALRCSLDMAEGYERYRSDIGDRPVKEYLYARIVPFLKNIYVFSLTNYSPAAREMLMKFDSELKRTSPELYRYIGSREASSFAGFRYLEFWREHQDMGIGLVRLFSRLYMTVIRIRNFRISQDPMAVPVSFR